MKRLLVFRFSAMGDVAMTVPVLYSLLKQYPDLKITVVSRGAFQPFFEGLSPNLSFYAADLKGKHKGLKGLFRLFKELRQMKFDAVADLHNVLRTKILCTFFRLSGVPVKQLHKGRKAKKALTRSKNKVRKNLPTSFERYTTVLNRLGFQFPYTFSSIFTHPSPLLKEIFTLTGDKGEQRWIGIAPFAKHAGKLYPLHLMEQVIEQLTQHSDYRIFLFGGGKSEMEILTEWEKKFPNTRTLSNQLKLRGELALISQLDVMISMDSSNMHMASLTNTPVVSIWGATHPCCGFMGWNQSIENAIQEELPCRPCSIFGNKPCLRNDYACLTQIAPERIIKQVNKLLGSNH